MKIRTGLTLVAILAAMTATTAFAQGSGADIYASASPKCAMCHGADGLASGPAGKAMQVPPFNSPALIKESDADLIAATKNGKGKMPAYAGKLTDAQIKSVVAFVRTLQKK